MNSLAFVSDKNSGHLRQFLVVYANFDGNTLEQLPTLYHDDAVFKDPIHELHGLSKISRYFQKMSNSLLSCEFDYTDVLEVGASASVSWKMALRHKKIKSGAEITVEGVSLLKFRQGKVFHHVDYYDLGAMLYEHLPVIGSVTKRIRHRLVLA